ncbi:hypothetical protein H5410_003950 [Solanum commersonii]|uniref:Uncharacterized protein n=1 Tax=Solanum commersonii TaxID=4109 RepID=A0A9J6B6D6_SOLCO|nr:hypothetical protein H5410_003950 [Solanum commersonii]
MYCMADIIYVRLLNDAFMKFSKASGLHDIVQLIKSDLFGVQAYWSQIFLIPKKVIKSIEQIYRTFLWTGNVTI